MRCNILKFAWIQKCGFQNFSLILSAHEII
jgi:hypothetical protein